MRYPENVILRGSDGAPLKDSDDKPLRLAFMVRWAIERCPHFNTDLRGAKSQDRLDKVLEEHGECDYLPIEQEDWERLNASFEQPGCPYPLSPVRLCLDGIEAMKQAKDKKPVPTESSEEPTAETN